MKTKAFLVCGIVFTLATSVAVAGGHHGSFGGGFARGGSGSFHGGNWNHCHGGHSSFVFIGGFPFFGYGYGYYPYGYGYYTPRYTAYDRGITDDATVAAVQRRLARGGYYHGSIDGVIGPGTRAAIRAFERNNGLAVDGVIDGQLLRRMGLA